MNVLVPQQGLEDLVASDGMTLDLHFDRAHEADEHGAVCQFVERARLREEHLQHFLKDLVVKQVNPEASLDDLLVLSCLRSVKYALKCNLYRSELLFLLLSQQLKLLLQLRDCICLDYLLMNLIEDVLIEDLRIKINQRKQQLLNSFLRVDDNMVFGVVRSHETFLVEVHGGFGRNWIVIS